jgi:hypothetical protein
VMGVWAETAAAARKAAKGKMRESCMCWEAPVGRAAI